MEKFDLTILFTEGHIKLGDCTILPGKEQIEKYIENTEALGIGKLRRIIIENIR